MKLVDLLDNLQQLGVLVLGAVADGTSRPTTPKEWIALLGDQGVLNSVKDLVGRFQGEDFGKLAKEAEAKQVAVEGGIAFADLEPEVQSASMAFGNLAVVLRGQDLAQKLKQSPFLVLADVLLPLIDRAVPLMLAAL